MKKILLSIAVLAVALLIGYKTTTILVKGDSINSLLGQVFQRSGVNSQGNLQPLTPPSVTIKDQMPLDTRCATDTIIKVTGQPSLLEVRSNDRLTALTGNFNVEVTAGKYDVYMYDVTTTLFGSPENAGTSIVGTAKLIPKLYSDNYYFFHPTLGSTSVGLVKAGQTKQFSVSKTISAASSSAGLLRMKLGIASYFGTCGMTASSSLMGPLNKQALPPNETNYLNILPGDVNGSFSISKVTATDEYFHHITWITNKESTSKVLYGSSSKNYYGFVETQGLVTNHKVSLTKLVRGATYYYVVESKDKYGTTIRSIEYKFKTPPKYTEL